MLQLTINHWRFILKQVKYLCIPRSGIVLPSGAEAEYFFREPMSKYLSYQKENRNLRDANFILVVTEIDLLFGAELAINYGLKLLIDGITYEFSETNLDGVTTEQKLRTLLSTAKEPKLFYQSLNELLKNLLKQVPIKKSESDIEKLALKAVPINLTIDGQNARDVAKKTVRQFLIKMKQEAKEFITPRISDKIKTINLSFKKELTEYIKNNPGFYVLNEKMGAGKTQDVILPLFNTFSLTDKKPIIITPTIALAKQLISDKRNYLNQKHLYVSELKAVASCVISATTNWKFQKYGKDSKICLIEEFDECESAICSLELMYPKTLNSCAEAMECWHELLQTETVVVADAMFSNFSAQQITNTGRTITIVKNTDKIKVINKALQVYSFNKNLDLLLKQLKNDKRCVAFCDGSHKINGKFKTIANVVREETIVIPIVVDSVFLKKEQPDYFCDLTANIEKEQLHIFSPVVTSGVSVISDKVDSIHLFACQTLLPTQLAQSTGRFRKSNQIEISFDSNQHNLNTYIKIIFQELTYKPYEKQCVEGLDQLYENSYCHRVLERISHNRRMREYYTFTAMQIFKEMGYEISISDTESDNSPTQKLVQKIIKANKEKLILIASETEYDKAEHYFLKNSFHQLIEEEQFRLEVYNFQEFYRIKSFENTTEAKELIIFDDNSKSRIKLEHFRILHGEYCSTNDPKLLVIEQIFKDIFKILNISMIDYSAKYTNENIDVLAQYIKTGKIEDYKVREELIALGCSINIIGEYENRGKLPQGILKKLFGITQLEKRNGALDANDKRPVKHYYLCMKKNQQISKYYDLKYIRITRWAENFQNVYKFKT